MKKNNLLILFLLSFVGIFAQVKFYAKGSSVAYVGKTYAISFVLENGKAKDFKFPKSYPGFELVGGPSQSSNYSWVNGKTTSSVSYTYYLQASKVGVFEIPKASVKVGKTIVHSKPIKVTVKKQVARNQQQQRGNSRKQNKQQQNQTTTSTDWKEEVSNNLFVKMYADKTNPYVGEQVTLYLKLYQRLQTFQTQITDMPEFKGFWVKDFQLKTDKWEKEEVDGVWYNTMMINKYALFPQREGAFQLTPIKLATIVQVRSQNQKSRSIWDQFFGSYEQKEYKFNSNRLKIKVKPLPKDRPEDFSGAVGSFRFSAKLDSTDVLTGSAITLKTKISGTGNIMMIDAPIFEFPEEFEIYDPQEKEYVSKKHSKISGTKKYDYLFIPNKPGEFVIDSIPFTYFELATKKYETIYSESFNLNVTPSSSYVEEVIEEPDENSLDSDIKNISNINDLDYKEEKFISTYGFWALWGSPALVFFLLLIGKNKIDNYDPDIVGINRKKANKVALSKLKQADVYLKQNDTKAFYNEIVRALWNYVSLKLNIQKEDLSKDNIQEKLLNAKVNEQTTTDYIDLINKSEMAVYSPIGETEMQKDFDKAKEIIINVEGELK